MAETGTSERRPGRVRRALSSATAAAVAVTTAAAVGVSTPAVPPVSAAAVSSRQVLTEAIELSALIAVGSSTNPAGTGVVNFFQSRFNPPGSDVRTVNFLTGPLGIYAALVSTDESDVVLSSGWGAANASALLSWFNHTDPAALAGNLWVLDNNVARPNGGWGTRYPVFALIGVNPIPTPEIDGVQVIDIGYQYDANSNAPAYFLNPIADLNSLVAYAQRRLHQSELYLPVQDDGTIVDATDTVVECPDTCRVVIGWEDDGTPQYAEIKKVGDTTYVTYLSNGLPLVQPLRLLGPVGSTLADVLEPIATVLVNAGYPDNDPITNPDRYVPGRFLPPPHVVVTALRQLPEAIQDGLARLHRPGSGSTGPDPAPETGRTESTRFAEAPGAVITTTGGSVAANGAERLAAAKPTPAVDDRRPTRRVSPNFSTRVGSVSGSAEDPAVAEDSTSVPKTGDAAPRRVRGVLQRPTVGADERPAGERRETGHTGTPGGADPTE